MNKEKLKELLFLPEDLIEALSAEQLPENIQEKVNAYHNSRFEFFKSTEDFKKSLASERTKAFSGTQLSTIKTLNNKFGLELTNPEMEKYPTVEEFVNAVLMPKVKEKEGEMSKNADKKLLEDLNLYKDKSSNYKTELDKLMTDIENIKSSEKLRADEEISNFKAQLFYLNEVVAKDEELASLNIPGKDFTLDAIRDRIFSNYKVSPDGSVSALDGTKAVHPEKDVNIGHVKELFEYFKNKAGLVKVSNAGEGGNPGGNYNRNDKGGEIPAHIKQKMDELAKSRRE